MWMDETTVVTVYPKVGPRLGHLQLPVVLAVRKTLKAEHLPCVIEASFVWWNRARTRCQMLCPAILLGKEQVPVGCAGVKCQGASVCNKKQRTTEVSYMVQTQTAGIWEQRSNISQALRPSFPPGWLGAAGLGTTAKTGLLSWGEPGEQCEAWEKKSDLDLKCKYAFSRDWLPSLSWPTVELTALSRSSDTSLEMRERISVTAFKWSWIFGFTFVATSFKRGTSMTTDSCWE